jgi:hypothetical protein
MSGEQVFADAEPGSFAELANTIGAEAAITIIYAAYEEARDDLAAVRAELADLRRVTHE